MQTNGPKDYEAVREIQDGFKLTPLSGWEPYVPGSTIVDASVDTQTPPLVQVNSMPAANVRSGSAG